ncbi:TonB-dependent receptor [Pontibacter vulgaris]|uniref:TonB-dependent receptor n=1 Tax=Pontibacter vulgaris TaxID=2905679 RepID=UPI001FA6F1DF|nr:TonB-dependent receptor [Pontibacter vulgaris]
MKKLLLLLTFLVGFNYAYAQSIAVFGTVQSSTDNSGLPGASVILKRTPSGAMLTTVTDGEGKFRFERVQAGAYTLEARFLGFSVLTKTVQVGQASLNLGVIALQEENNKLSEVQVVGRAPLGEQKGDTTQLNAKAFKTAPDASAEDLVTKMPGITVNNGTIQAQGEDVKQVMIDGKRYTGEDVNSAMRNLSSDMIENVQVFDGQSDQAAFSGFEDGNRVKTINFITKKERRQGYVGKASAGYGTDDRYMVGASLNYFNNSRRITVTGLTNNINMFDFSVGETPGGGMRGRRMWGGGSPNGIINTNTFGLNYNDMWGKKMEVSANYNYTNRDIVNNQFRYRENISGVNEGQEYNENSLNENNEDSHRFNFRLQYNINSNNRLLITPNISFQQNNNLINRTANTIAGNGDALSQSLSKINSDNINLNFNNTILYSHRFGSSGRILTANFNTNYSNTDGDNYQLEDVVNYSDETRNFYRNQYSSIDRSFLSWNGNANYSQKLGQNSRLQLEYSIGNQKNDSDRRTFDFVETDGAYSSFNTPLSSTFKSDYLSQSFGPSYQYRTEKVRFQANARYQYATLESKRVYPTVYPLNRDFTNILPSAEYEYKFSNSRNLNINYRSSTNVPSVEQLQDVLDISNSLQLRRGNAALEQDFQNRINVRYRDFNPETNRVFFIGMFATKTDNYIANSVYTQNIPAEFTEGYEAQPGARFSRPVNMDGYWNVRSFFNYGQPVNFISSNFNLNGWLGYTKTPGMIDGNINFSKTSNFGLGINLSSNISEKIDFNVSTNSTYNIVKNTFNTRQNNNYFNQSSSLRYNWILWKDLVYRTELNHQYNSGLSAGVDKSYLLWNMSLGKKVFKNKQGEVSLSVNDLLKQNVSIQRNVQPDYVEDVQSTVLQRFFMLTFSYNIRSFGAPNPDSNQNMRQGPPGMRGGGFQH